MNKKHQNYFNSLVKEILEFEKRNNLLELNIEGVFVWQSLRTVINEKLQSELANSSLFSNKKPSLFKVFKNYRSYLYLFKALTFDNPYWDRKRFDIIIFESSRVYNVDGEFVDIYTHYLIDDIKSQDISYTIYQENYLTNLFLKRNCKKYSIEILNFLNKFRNKSLVLISNDQLDKIDYLTKKISELFGVKIDLKALFITEIKKFKLEYKFYLKLLKRKRTKGIYFIANNKKSALIKAAKDLGITTTEIQHGLMVNKDLIYHFPYTEENTLEYFPDRFFVWDKTIITAKLPISEDKIIEYGNKYLDNRVSKFREVRKKGNQILVISQPTLTNEITNYFVRVMDELKSYRVVYKMHPVEESRAHSISNFDLLKVYPNFCTVGNEVSTYYLLAESKYVIGVYSTAMYEATFFSCKIGLLNLPGVELLDHIMNNPFVRLFDMNVSFTENLQSFE